MANIKKNFAYSGLLTSANYIFPLLTYPYVSRVLGVSNIGICNFVDSIINYYIMFATMGIGVIGIREIAAHRGDKERLSHTFSNLFFLNAVSTSIVLVLLCLSIFIFPKLAEYKGLMFVGLFKILFNFLLIDWFYKGIEDFRYITKFGLITKIVYVVSVFVFVREKDDYGIYYFLTMAMFAMNATINMWHSRCHVHWDFSRISIKKYLKPFFTIGSYVLLTSMYTTFNVTYLGFVCGETEVGYYTTATKLHSVFLALFTAFTGVMMPRMSNLISGGNTDEFNALMRKSVHVLLLFACPVVAYTVVYATEIVDFIAGDGYEYAVTPMRIVMPLILIIGYEQIGVLQVLMPLKKDNVILRSAFAGATVGIVANILFVEKFGCEGSAFVWVVSEFTVLLLVNRYIVKHFSMKFPFKDLFASILYSLPCVLVTIGIGNVLDGLACMIVGLLFVVAYYYILYEYVLKDSMVVGMVHNIYGKIRKPR